MIPTAMLLAPVDFLLLCPHCDHPTWASDAHALSRTEWEWECLGCGRFVYRED